MGTTAISAFPYPEPTDPVAGGADAIKNLAAKIDATPDRLFATVGDRDTKWPSPPDGSTCYVSATQRNYQRVGGVWATIPIVIGTAGGVTPDAGGNGVLVYARAFPAGTVPVVVGICTSYANVGLVPFNTGNTQTSLGLRRPTDNAPVTAAVQVAIIATLV